MILDCGATKTVAGHLWMTQFLDFIDKDTKEKIKTTKEKRMFRFGNNVSFPSMKEVSIPLTIGHLESQLHISVIDATIPLLLGRSDMEKLGFIVDFEKNIVKTSRTNETFALEKTN